MIKIMKGFHYTQLNKFPEMLVSLKERGEAMKKRPLCEPLFSERGTFAFLEPEPREWMENSFLPNVWKHVRAQFGELLLELEIDPNRACVLNYAPMYYYHYAPDYTDEETGQSMPSATLPQVADAYVSSRRTVAEYLKSESKYQLPEVFIPYDVHWTAVTIAPHQPQILADLDSIAHEKRDEYLKHLNLVPEISALLQRGDTQ